MFCCGCSNEREEINLKCIVCEKDTEFVVKGYSLCREHFPDDIKKELGDIVNYKRQKEFGFKTNDKIPQLKDLK